MKGFLKRNWQILAAVGFSLVFFLVSLWFVMLPAWRECLAEHSWMFCAAALIN